MRFENPKISPRASFCLKTVSTAFLGCAVVVGQGQQIFLLAKKILFYPTEFYRIPWNATEIQIQRFVHIPILTQILSCQSVCMSLGTRATCFVVVVAPPQRLPRDCERIPGFRWSPMDSNESLQGSRACLWSEAFNFVMAPPAPPGGFP